MIDLAKAIGIDPVTLNINSRHYSLNKYVELMIYKKTRKFIIFDHVNFLKDLLIVIENSIQKRQIANKIQAYLDRKGE